MTTDGLALRTSQRISIALHRETARAILRRQQVVDEDEVPGGWEVLRDCQMADKAATAFGLLVIYKCIATCPFQQFAARGMGCLSCLRLFLACDAMNRVFALLM